MDVASAVQSALCYAEPTNRHAGSWSKEAMRTPGMRVKAAAAMAVAQRLMVHGCFVALGWLGHRTALASPAATALPARTARAAGWQAAPFATTWRQRLRRHDGVRNWGGEGAAVGRVQHCTAEARLWDLCCVRLCSTCSGCASGDATWAAADLQQAGGGGCSACERPCGADCCWVWSWRP